MIDELPGYLKCTKYTGKSCEGAIIETITTLDREPYLKIPHFEIHSDCFLCPCFDRKKGLEKLYLQKHS